MRIAVVNETSACESNNDILTNLARYDHEIINAGMKNNGTDPELSYIDTGFMGALLLNSGRADFIVGGCGTGQGFLISVMQYPGVYCGVLHHSLDAWLFSRINAGNCVSLALRQGYGWAGNVNMSLIFEQLFNQERGTGYPDSRKEAQISSRIKLQTVSLNTHYNFTQIIKRIDPVIVHKVLEFPGIWEILDVQTMVDSDLASALISVRHPAQRRNKR